MRIMAWDPAYREGGAAWAFGVADRGAVDERTVVLGVADVRGAGEAPDVVGPEAARLGRLALEVHRIVRRYRPEAVGVEVLDNRLRDAGWLAKRRGLNTDAVRKLAMATGAIIAAARAAGAAVYGLPVLAWMAGRRHDEVVWQVRARYPRATAACTAKAHEDRIMALGMVDRLATDLEIERARREADGRLRR